MANGQIKGPSMIVAEDIRKADETHRDFAGKAVKSACYAPFVSLHLTTTGQVLACCRNENFVLGNIKDQRLREIWNGGRIAALRKALIDYKFGLGCAYCEWESRRGVDSFAIRTMSDPYPVDSAQPEWPAVIEFTLTNSCNLECIMCCGEYSSTIRALGQGLPPMPKLYDDQFFEDLRRFLPHLRFMNFLGGEPFLGAESHRIWDMMIEDKLTTSCRVTTNATQYNARVERVLNAIPMNLTVSFDGMTKKTFESVRKRANFETVSANIHRFNEYTQQRGTTFGIAFCLMRQNWHELGDLMLFAEELDCELSINVVTGPSYCSLFTLPPDELRAIRDEIASWNGAIAPQLRRHRKAWEETLQHLQAATENASQIQGIETIFSYYRSAEDPIPTARKLAAAGLYDKALQKLKDLGPGHNDYYFSLASSGYIRGLQGDVTGAEEDLEKALQISRKLPDAFLHLARIRFGQGRTAEALENTLHAKDSVVPEEPSDAQFHSLLAFIYARQWRMLRSYRALRRLISLPQTSREGHVVADSQEGVLRSLAEMDNNTGSFRARSLVFRLGVLLRAAEAGRRFGLKRNASRAKKSTRASQARDAHSGEPSQLLADARAKKSTRWTLRVAGANKARLMFTEGRDRLSVVIEEAHSAVNHDIQLNYASFEICAERAYGLKFRIRADEPRSVGYGIAKAGSPWANLGFYQGLTITDSWQEVEAHFLSGVANEIGRIHFDLGGSGVSVEVASLVWTDLGARESNAQKLLVTL